MPNGISGEYQAKQMEAGFVGYQNTAYAYSQPHLSTLAVTKYATSLKQPKYLKRSASTVSQFVSASRLSGLNDLQAAQQMNASHVTGYAKNEFDTSKFTTGLVFRAQSQYDLPSFGLDPDEPIFVTGPYGRGGVPQADYYQRPFSALSGTSPWNKNHRQIPTDNSLQVRSCS